MKKTLLLISGLIFFSFVVSAQMNVSVSLNDEIYELKGLVIVDEDPNQ